LSIAARPSSAAHQRGCQTIGRGRVEWLGVDGGAQQRHRLGELALLHQQLPEIDGRADVCWIQLADPRERLHRIIDAIGGAGDQAEDVVGLRAIRQRRLRRFELLARRIGLAAVEQRDAEIQPCERECGIDLERAPEGGSGGGEVVLLEAGDADVVGAVGVFADGDAPGV
jgi:hypothetical protein